MLHGLMPISWQLAIPVLHLQTSTFWRLRIDVRHLTKADPFMGQVHKRFTNDPKKFSCVVYGSFLEVIIMTSGKTSSIH